MFYYCYPYSAAPHRRKSDLRSSLYEKTLARQVWRASQVSQRIWHLWAEAVQAKLSAPPAVFFWPCGKAATVFGGPLSSAELPPLRNTHIFHRFAICVLGVYEST